jgi:hypothetical protein
VKSFVNGQERLGAMATQSRGHGTRAIAKPQLRPASNFGDRGAFGIEL